MPDRTTETHEEAREGGGGEPAGEIEVVIAEVVHADDEAVALVLDHVADGLHVNPLSDLRWEARASAENPANRWRPQRLGTARGLTSWSRKSRKARLCAAIASSLTSMAAYGFGDGDGTPMGLLE